MSSAEQELQQYRTIAARFNDPKLKGKYLALYKEAFPDAAVPEIDIPSRLEKDFGDKLEQRDKELAELKERLYKKELDDNFEKRRNQLSGAPWFLADDDLKQVDELVEKKGFPSFELAADYYRATTQPLRPSALGLSGFTPSKNRLQELAEFNNKFAGVFKKKKNDFKAVFDDAYNKAFVTGEYQNEMGKR